MRNINWNFSTIILHNYKEEHMDIEIAYSIFGIMSMLVIAFFTLRSTRDTPEVKTKEQKRIEIINEYSKSLQEAMKGFESGDEKRTEIKRLLLKKYSEELSQNIFFDKHEIREIIAELAGE